MWFSVPPDTHTPTHTLLDARLHIFPEHFPTNQTIFVLELPYFVGLETRILCTAPATVGAEFLNRLRALRIPRMEVNKRTSNTVEVPLLERRKGSASVIRLWSNAGKLTKCQSALLYGAWPFSASRFSPRSCRRENAYNLFGFPASRLSPGAWRFQNSWHADSREAKVMFNQGKIPQANLFFRIPLAVHVYCCTTYAPAQ